MLEGGEQMGSDYLIERFDSFSKICGLRHCINVAKKFNKLDERGPYDLYTNLKQHIETIKYIATTDKPFEPNVPHHFAFRGADDVTYIVSEYLAAKLAKKLGIKTPEINITNQLQIELQLVRALTEKWTSNMCETITCLLENPKLNQTEIAEILKKPQSHISRELKAASYYEIMEYIKLANQKLQSI